MDLIARINAAEDSNEKLMLQQQLKQLIMPKWTRRGVGR